jgi:hypothetical protein
MISRWVVFLALGSVALADTAVLAQRREGRRRDQQAGRYGWVSSLEEGKAQARKNGKPLMVVMRCVP